MIDAINLELPIAQNADVSDYSRAWFRAQEGGLE